MPPHETPRVQQLQQLVDPAALFLAEHAVGVAQRVSAWPCVRGDGALRPADESAVGRARTLCAPCHDGGSAPHARGSTSGSAIPSSYSSAAHGRGRQLSAGVPLARLAAAREWHCNLTAAFSPLEEAAAKEKTNCVMSTTGSASANASRRPRWRALPPTSMVGLPGKAGAQVRGEDCAAQAAQGVQVPHGQLSPVTLGM